MGKIASSAGGRSLRLLWGRIIEQIINGRGMDGRHMKALTGQLRLPKGMALTGG